MPRKKRDDLDVPGDAVASNTAYVRHLVRQAETILSFELLLEKMDEEERFLAGMSVRFPSDDSPEFFVVVRGDGPRGKEVAFHGAATLAEALVGTINRLRNGSMKWQEDAYG